MSFAPDRISVKRRRQDEPVDLLYLEQPGQKRRATNYFFQRVEKAAKILVIAATPASHQSSHAQPNFSDIPSIKTTTPGDEVKDFTRYRLAQAARKTQSSPADDISSVSAVPPVSSSPEGKSSHGLTPSQLNKLRRFHFSKGWSPTTGPTNPNKVKKTSKTIRPPLPTFIERQAPIIDPTSQSRYLRSPTDRILDPSREPATATLIDAKLSEKDLETLVAAENISTTTFVKPRSPQIKHGQSIEDHPSTWDRESDQLANELAALAMELDPDSAAMSSSPVPDRPTKPSRVDPVQPISQEGDDFVYETYVRVADPGELRHGSGILDEDVNMGVLVIDEEDEEMWLKYVESDEESDWDEEDSNAEDNPANDYPEDEVSSDDEYGHNAYKYRQYGSDDEDLYRDAHYEHSENGEEQW